MKYNKCYLPNGRKVDVTQVLDGFRFTLSTEDTVGSFPPGWTVTLSTEQGKDNNDLKPASNHDVDVYPSSFTTPSLDRDTLCLSSLFSPHGKDIKPSSASTRQIAMVLWVTFFWYFHEQEPNPHILTPESAAIPEVGRVTRDWRLSVRQKGLLGGKRNMFKLERLGLVACDDASVGIDKDSDKICGMFISQRAFWQLDPRLYLVSPSTCEPPSSCTHVEPTTSMDALGAGFPFGAGPKTYGILLPAYFPPQPQQYASTQNVRHPVRPKSYRQGEVFYVRYIQSGREYLTFRVPALPNTDVRRELSHPRGSPGRHFPDLCLDSDLWNDAKLLHKWMEGRSADSTLIRKGSISAQLEFLEAKLSSRNSFPLLACWDSTAIGYFELFWVLEDDLGRYLGDSGEFDRGIRCFIGDTSFLSPYYIRVCLSSLVHHCLQYDQRTQVVIFDIRADNMRYVQQRDTVIGLIYYVMEETIG